MRKEIFEKVRRALMDIERSGERVIKHVALWNQNVEFIEQEDGWERPAVFLEFGTIEWRAVKDGEYRGRGLLRLHVVTDWVPEEMPKETEPSDEVTWGETGVWDLCDSIDRVLYGLRGETFHELRLVESKTNHNHEEIIETIETYEVMGVRHSFKSGLC